MLVASVHHAMTSMMEKTAILNSTRNQRTNDFGTVAWYFDVSVSSLKAPTEIDLTTVDSFSCGGAELLQYPHPVLPTGNVVPH